MAWRFGLQKLRIILGRTAKWPAAQNVSRLTPATLCDACEGIHGVGKPCPRWFAIPRRLFLLERQRWTCGICHLPITSANDASIDHILPKSHGGTDVLANLQAAHKECNNRKASRVFPVWVFAGVWTGADERPGSAGGS